MMILQQQPVCLCKRKNDLRRMTETGDGRRETGDGINLLFVEASLQENDICKEMTSIKPKTRHLQDCKVFARNVQVATILQEFYTRLNPR